MVIVSIMIKIRLIPEMELLIMHLGLNNLQLANNHPSEVVQNE